MKRIIALMFLFAAGCASSTAPGVSGQPGHVTHVVLIWLKNPADEYEKDRLIQLSREFITVPGMISVRAGRPLPSDRKVVDSSYDVGIAMTFRNVEALNAYEISPRHIKAVEKELKPVVRKQVVYDFIE